MAPRLLGAGPGAERRVRARQPLIGEGRRDDAASLATHQRLGEATLGEADGVRSIDGGDIPKRGDHSAGAARRWCGATGKTALGQAGVFLGHARRRGDTRLDRRLDLPERWFTAAYRDRWVACAIPPDTPFRTKPVLAGARVAAVMAARRVRARWLACDEGFGDSPALLDQIAAHDLWGDGRVAERVPAPGGAPWMEEPHAWPSANLSTDLRRRGDC